MRERLRADATTLFGIKKPESRPAGGQLGTAIGISPLIEINRERVSVGSTRSP
jgi:hypothetical protein